jgi:hypothetical protein
MKTCAVCTLCRPPVDPIMSSQMLGRSRPMVAPQQQAKALVRGGELRCAAASLCATPCLLPLANCRRHTARRLAN